jgi:hypothetical protein
VNRTERSLIVENGGKTLVSVAEARSTLLHYFESKAAFRRAVLEKFPWHADKNEWYARSLELLAEYVRGLPADDPTLRALASCPYLCGKEAAILDLPSDPSGTLTFHDQDATHAAPRGRAMETGDCAKWFASWAEVVMDEAKELAEAKQAEQR